MKFPITIGFVLTAWLAGQAAFGQHPAASAPAPESAPSPAPSAGAAEFSSNDTQQRLGLPTYALDQCRSGQGFFCDFLAGLLQSMDKWRLPQQFSTDLKLDELATRAFEANCEKGITYGCFQLGMRLKGVSRKGAAEKKFQRAVRVSEAACAKKYWPGCLLLIVLSRASDATPGGEAKRKNFLRLSCEGGFAPACEHPATEDFFTIMNSGPGRGQMGGASLLWLCQLEGASHCALLGWTELLGMPGAKADPVAAFGHFQKACDLGDGMGCQMLGFAHRFGVGTAVNPARANRYMTQACDLKMGYACLILGGDYWDPEARMLDDPQQAFKRYTQSCDAEYGAGCAMLAKMHLAGEGAPKNPEQARALLQKACELRFEPACQVLVKKD